MEKRKSAGRVSNRNQLLERSVLNLGKKVGLSKTAGNKSTASTTRNNTHHVADIYLRTGG